MTRIRRTTALITAAVLALGVTACSAKHQNTSDVKPADVSTVSPEPGYAGAGVPVTSSTAATATDEAEQTGQEGQIDPQATEAAEPTTVVVN
jgi:hypothetical protein